MTVVSNNPSWWPIINSIIFFGYWIVAAGVVVVCDWVLTLGQEIELIWRQRWSFMTVLYLVIRYIGPLYSVMNAMPYMTMVSLTDAGCNIIYYSLNMTSVVVTAMLDVIMIARLHAMYQRSRIMLIFLVVIFLAVNVTCGVIAVLALKHIVAEEQILSGAHICGVEGDVQLLLSMIWMLNAVWEVLTLCLSVWIAVKHFRDLRRPGPSTGSTIGDCFTVLIKSHVLYFASFAGVSCLQFSSLSPSLLNSNYMEAEILYGVLEILLSVKLFVLGPRLVLVIREYHVTLVANSDAEISMKSMVFQENVQISTSSSSTV